jgi:hypothetical protein
MTFLRHTKSTAGNSGFCNIGAAAIHISSGSLFGFSSGRSIPIWLFVVIFIFSISIGNGYGQTSFKSATSPSRIVGRHLARNKVSV